MEFNLKCEIDVLQNFTLLSKEAINLDLHIEKCNENFHKYYNNLEISEKNEINILEDFSRSFGKDYNLNERVKCGIHCLFLLTRINNYLNKKLEVTSGTHNPENIPIKQIFTTSQIQIVKDAAKFVCYSSLISCVDNSVALFFKVKMVSEKNVFYKYQKTNEPAYTQNCLKIIFDYLSLLYKNKSIGCEIRSYIIEELFCALVQASFSPNPIWRQNEDLPFFRQELDYLITNSEGKCIPQLLLFIKGLPEDKVIDRYFKNVSHSIFVKRYLMNVGKLGDILDGALQLCEHNNDICKRNLAIAKVMTSVRVKNEEEFFHVFGMQISTLMKSRCLSLTFHQLIGIIIVQLIERSSSFADKFVVSLLIEPLVALTAESSILPNKQSLSDSLSSLCSWYVRGMNPDPILNKHIRPCIIPLFSISLLPTISLFKREAKNCLLRYLGQLESSDCISTMLSLCNLKNNPEMPSLRRGLNLRVEGEHLVASYEDKFEEDFDTLVSRRIDLIVELLSSLKMPALVQGLYEVMPLFLKFDCLNDETVPDTLLLTNDDKDELKLEKLLRFSYAAELLRRLSDNEQLTDQLFGNFSSVNTFFGNLLTIGGQSCDDLEFLAAKEEVLLNSLMALYWYITEQLKKGEPTYEEWRRMEEFLPNLKAIKLVMKGNPIVVEYAHQLITIAATHSIPSDLKKTKDEQTDSVSYLDILKLVSHPHESMKGHGLILVSRLLRSKDPIASANKETLFSLTEQSLAHEDSYVYLAAINAMADLADLDPQKSLVVLVKHYLNAKKDEKVRLKVGEVLTKTSERMGPLLPKFRDLFLNVFLAGARDGSCIIRASSFSNLGSVCENLRFAIGNRVYEVVSEVGEAVKSNDEEVVRRAAIFVFGKLIKGLGIDCFKVLKDVLKDVYKLLKELERSGTSEDLREQAASAIAEIDKVTKQYMMPELNLTKKIYVTEIPPS